MIHSRQSRPGEWQRGLVGILSLILLAYVIACFAFSSPAQAQQQKIAKIGFVGVRPEAANYSAKSVLDELQKLGYVEGKTFTFQFRSADNQLDRLPGIVDGLIRLKLDVLITAATRELHVAKNATKDLPLVSLNLGDPIASGLVQSLARPGGNITGFTPLSIELTSKRLALLKETAPAVSHAAVLIHPLVTSAETWKQSWEESERVATKLGIEIRSFKINAEAEWSPLRRLSSRSAWSS